MSELIKYDLNKTIEEIQICYANKCYLAALRMALMLPDACCKIKNKDSKRLEYVKWVNTWVSCRFPTPTLICDPNASWGNIIYSLRCALFHNNYLDVCDKNYKYYELHEFEFFIKENNNDVPLAMKFTQSNSTGDVEFIKKMGYETTNGLKIQINIKVLIDCLCYGAQCYIEHSGEEFPKIKIRMF